MAHGVEAGVFLVADTRVGVVLETVQHLGRLGTQRHRLQPPGPTALRLELFRLVPQEERVSELLVGISECRPHVHDPRLLAELPLVRPHLQGPFTTVDLDHLVVYRHLGTVQHVRGSFVVQFPEVPTGLADLRQVLSRQFPDLLDRPDICGLVLGEGTDQLGFGCDDPPQFGGAFLGYTEVLHQLLGVEQLPEFTERGDQFRTGETRVDVSLAGLDETELVLRLGRVPHRRADILAHPVGEQSDRPERFDPVVEELPESIRDELWIGE